MYEWISVKDKLPENNNMNFTVIMDDGFQKKFAIASYFFAQETTSLFKKHDAFWEVYISDTIIRPFTITHWMPLELPNV